MVRFKISLLADANIPEYMVDHLKRLDVPVESVNNLSIKDSGDDIILKGANKRKAFLLTDNGKDFFYKDDEFPFHDLTGIIVIDKRYCFCEEIADLLRHHKEGVKGKKYRLTADGTKVKFQRKGKKPEQHTLEEDECPCMFNEKGWK